MKKGRLLGRPSHVTIYSIVYSYLTEIRSMTIFLSLAAWRP